MQKLRQVGINIFLIAILAVVTFGVVRATRQALTLRFESGDLAGQLAALQKEKADLEARIRELDHPGTIERKAKEQFNLKRPGEQVVVVVAEEAAAKPEPELSTTQRWWAAISSIFSR